MRRPPCLCWEKLMACLKWFCKYTKENVLWKWNALPSPQQQFTKYVERKAVAMMMIQQLMRGMKVKKYLAGVFFFTTFDCDLHLKYLLSAAIIGLFFFWFHFMASPFKSFFPFLITLLCVFEWVARFLIKGIWWF